MNFVRKQDDIGIVVLGNFNPTVITPKWMYEKGVITEVEWNDQNRNIIVSIPETQYKFGSISFLSKPNRIQLTSTDIADAGRITRMAHDTLLAYGDTQLGAVGINAGLLFYFNSREDSDVFGEYFSHLDHMGSFVDGGKLRSIVFEGQNDADAETPKTQITIASVGTETIEFKAKKKGEKNTKIEVPLCSININNHFIISKQEEACAIFERSEELQAEFRYKYQKLFESI